MTEQSMLDEKGVCRVTAVELSSLYSWLHDLNRLNPDDDTQPTHDVLTAVCSELAYIIERAGYNPDDWQRPDYWQV